MGGIAGLGAVGRSFKAVLVGVFTLFLVVSGSAEAQSFRFNAIDVQGNQRIDAATIATFAEIPRGAVVSAADLNGAFQRIQDTGLFESVEIDPQGGTLVIRVVELPTINRVSIEGNRRLSDDALAPVLRSTPSRIYSPSQAEADAERLTDAYAQSGRLAATVEPRIIRLEDNRVDLIFEISEGRVIEIERVSFVGNREFSERRLRGVLGTKQAGIFRNFIRSDTFVADRIEFDKQLLRDFYSTRGYIDFQTLSVTSEFARERNAFFVTFNIREGQQFRFGEITTVSDVAEIDPQVYADALRVDTGDIYSPTTVDNNIARLERLAIQQGLDFIRVEPRVTRNDRTLTLDVEFEIVRGERIFVERIDIEGNATTLDRVIRRQFRVVEGDPFNPREIRQAAERIRALGFFSTASVNARDGSSPDQVVVDVDVEEQPTGALTFGASFSSDDGLGLAVSLTETNFLGRGQFLRFSINTGSDNADSEITFAEPAFLGRGLRFSTSFYYRTSNNDDQAFDTKQIGFSPSLRFPVAEFSTLSLNYTLEENELSDVERVDRSVPTTGSSAILKAEEGSLLTSSIGYNYTYDTRGVGLNPNAGVLLTFGQDYAGLGGDTNFIRTTARLTGETKVFQNDVTLRATLEGGALTFLEGNSRITDRFSLNSRRMRGFSPNGVGPRDLGVSNEDALGGNYFAVARLESEFPLGLPEEYGITGGLFFDVGSVWGLDNVNGGPGGGQIVDDSFSLRSVIGFSLFWDTQIGPLRFNFSRALQKEDFDDEETFDFTISTRF